MIILDHLITSTHFNENRKFNLENVILKIDSERAGNHKLMEILEYILFNYSETITFEQNESRRFR